MNGALKWKLATGFLLVFIAGAVTGGFLATVLTRHILFLPAHHGMAADRMRARLRTELDLTPEQMTRISPILDKAGKQLEQIRNETAQRVHQTFAQVHRDISVDLTDQQRQKFEEMQRRHQRWLHHHRHDGGPGMPEPPPE